jgi:hypothetical protein
MIDFQLLEEYLEALKEYGIKSKEYSIPHPFTPIPLKRKEPLNGKSMECPYHRSMKNGYACPMHLFDACKEKPCLLMGFQQPEPK